MEIGKAFDDFEQFQSGLHALERETNSKFVIKSSTRVESTKNTNKKFDPKLRFASVTYVCKHYGSYSHRGKGIRPNQRSYKLGCPVKLVTTVNRKTMKLVITHFQGTHNHACTSPSDVENRTKVKRKKPSRRRPRPPPSQDEVPDLSESSLRLALPSLTFDLMQQLKDDDSLTFECTTDKGSIVGVHAKRTRDAITFLTITSREYPVLEYERENAWSCNLLNINDEAYIETATSEDTKQMTFEEAVAKAKVKEQAPAIWQPAAEKKETVVNLGEYGQVEVDCNGKSVKMDPSFPSASHHKQTQVELGGDILREWGERRKPKPRKKRVANRRAAYISSPSAGANAAENETSQAVMNIEGEISVQSTPVITTIAKITDKGVVHVADEHYQSDIEKLLDPESVVVGEFPILQVGDKFRCTECPVLFNTKASMIAHMRYVHKLCVRKPLSLIKCPDCDKTFRQRNRFKEHCLHKHNVEKPFICDLMGCSATFKSAYNLRDHKRIAHYKMMRYACPNCNRQFENPAWAVKHHYSCANMQKTPDQLRNPNWIPVEELFKLPLPNYNPYDQDMEEFEDQYTETDMEVTQPVQVAYERIYVQNPDNGVIEQRLMVTQPNDTFTHFI